MEALSALQCLEELINTTQQSDWPVSPLCFIFIFLALTPPLYNTLIHFSCFRWGDGAGVYFYPAVITERLGEEEVKVTFLADKIERTVRRDTGVITVDQLRPDHQLTVKHDLYSAYEVTASLLKLTKRGKNDYDYQIKISATDSEPQNNEDTRVVKHEEVTLNGELNKSRLLSCQSSEL